MRVNGPNNIAFKRKFTPKEEYEAKFLHEQAQKTLKHTGHNILIIHDTCLPTNPKEDTGIGHLLSKEGMNYIKDMKTYLGINNIEVHPQGEYYISSVNKFCCPYSATGLSLGEHLIPLDKLCTNEFGNLLKESDIEPVVKANTAPNKAEIVNFENIINKISPTANENALEKAYQNFKANQPSKIKTEFETFKSLNWDWLDKYAIYRALLKDNKKRLTEWNELDKNLFNLEYDINTRKNRINEITAKHSELIEFYKFKQFLAEKSLQLARAELHKQGLKLTGDCLIGFGDETVFAFPNAFMKDKTVGWGIRALDYDKILDENSEAAKLLKRKVELFAKRYDGIRFDVSWAYLMPALRKIDDKNSVEHRPLNSDKLLRMIENTVKSVKGDNYDLTNLIHEFEASSADFPLNQQNRNFTKDRIKVYSMQYMKYGWGYLDGYKASVEFEPETIVIGLGNQDGVPHSLLSQIKPVDFSKISHEEQLKILTQTLGGKPEDLEKRGERTINQMVAKYTELASYKNEQIKILAKKFNVNPEIIKNDSKEFAKLKAAEAFSGKHSMFYFMDIFGSNKVFDAHELSSYENYRYRIPNNYLKIYIDAVIDGYGINMFDIYEKQFKAQGLDKKHPKLYAKIIEFKNILLAPDNIKTRAINKKLVLIAGVGILLLITIHKFLHNKKGAS